MICIYMSHVETYVYILHINAHTCKYGVWHNTTDAYMYQSIIEFFWGTNRTVRINITKCLISETYKYCSTRASLVPEMFHGK